MKDIASKYLKLGLSVIPINRETKIPAVDWKIYQTRLATEQELEIFRDGSMDLGIVTGELSGIFVLDLDLQHPEAVAFKNKYPMPRTWFEQTKNGFHYYFRYTPELTKKKTLTRAILAPGVDSRGDKGIVKCAPSQGYKWIVSPFGNPLALPPQWLIDLLPNKDGVIQVVSNTESDEHWVTTALNSIVPLDSVKGRTPTFLRVVGRLKKKGLTESEIKSFLEPWAIKHDYQKLDKLISDQFVRYPAPIQVNGDSPDIEVFLENEQTVTWIVPGLIANGTIGFVCGLPEAGKTWLLMDLAIEIARGGMWLGKFQTRQGKVLFIDQERFKGETQRRLKTLLAGKNLKSRQIKDSLFVKCGTTTRIDLEHSYQAFKKELSELRPDVVVVDSFVTFHSREENNRKDIQEVLERIKQLRTEFGCTFIFLDHNGKSAYQAQQEGQEVTYITQAGSIAKPAAAEFEFSVVKSGEDIMCYNTKNNLATTLDPFMFRIKDLNTDHSSIQIKAY